MAHHQGFLSRLSKQERDTYETKVAAADFYRANRVPEEIERALNELFLRKPPDVHGFLADHFANLSAPPRIIRLNGRQVYDSRGQPSVEVDVFCIVRNKERGLPSPGVQVTSAGVSGLLGPEELADHVTTAVQWIDEPLNNMLQGQSPFDQSEVDRALSSFFRARSLEQDEIRNREKENLSPGASEVVPPPVTPASAKDKKSKKSKAAEKPIPPAEPPEPVLAGSLAIGSVSLAVAATGAQLRGVPLYRYIAALRGREAPAKFHIPVSLVTLLSCGKASPGKLSLLEEILLVPKAGQRVKQTITMTLELQKEMIRIMNSATKAGVTPAALHDSGAPAVSFEKPEQPLDLVGEACANLGLALGTDIHLAANCAARELMDYTKGKYEVTAGVFKSPDELMDVYKTLVGKYTAVVALIDPFRREDREQWEMLGNLIGGSCSLLSDVTQESRGPPLPGVRGHVLKHVHETTVSDLIRVASEHRGSVLMGTTYSEPCINDSLSDIAVGLGLDYVKLGGLSGAERMTKYNRLISIEEELVQQGILVSKEKHSPPLFGETL
ncbi:putative enolase-like protein ENO4 [Scophthalmus maximus]|uniref:Enolase 4 n=1 Tax=Scophthalmus maximus TaxID=52904 RepID=A0A2U9CD12_SCOMX|nr:putative enolase-like protein ENO4 [Scophthalmus maximus]